MGPATARVAAHGEVIGSAMAHDDAGEARRRVQDLAAGFRGAGVLLACAELGVFDALAAGSSTPGAVAAQTGTDARAVELLLNAATSLGLLLKTGGQFRLAPDVAPLLVRGTPGSLAGSLVLQSAHARRWAHLAEAVRSGRRPPENTRDEAPADWVERFVLGIYAAAAMQAPAVAEVLELPRDRDLRLLDVGGCHGAYSMALASRYPRLSAVVLDLPAVVAVAERLIADAGWGDRVRASAGDFHHDALGTGFDVALVFGVLNGEPPEARPALIRKVFDALAPGGWIVLRDSVLDPDRAGPTEAALFAVQMLLATDGGGLDTRDDWVRWLAEAGFEAPEDVATAGGAAGTLVVARRPA